jgi:hypothetical protein
MALPLDSNSQLGSLSLSARDPAAFDVIGRAQASLLAALAGIALSVARSHRNEEQRVESLRAALISRETLGEAAGILMERDKISAPRALQILRQASQRLNLKLGEVAQNMIDNVDYRPAAARQGRGRPGSFKPGPGRHCSRTE